MYVHSVKLVNYKSIGDYPESEIILEPKVTAIIGKNESGKSNILDGMSRINFHKNNSEAFTQNIINRNSSIGTTNEYIIILKSSPDDIDNKIDDTQLVISNNHCAVSGGLLKYYQENIHTFFEDLVEALDTIGDNPFQAQDQDLVRYRNCKQELTDTGHLDLYHRGSSLDYLHERANKIIKDEQDHYLEVLSIARDAWFNFICFLPTFYFRNSEKQLKTTYKVDDIEKELKRSNALQDSLLYDFVHLIGIPPEEFISAARSGTSAPQESTRHRINRFVKSKINDPFHDFYQTEAITLDLSFNAGTVTFTVQSNDGETLMLSERSNGLRWYLETFIDIQANNIPKRNVVYLLDEPGTSLHVNAQRELLRLFQQLASKGNQVVYTTHSPYMLDLETDGVHRIRAVVKNAEGNTYIYKTAYDARISSESQQDTLAPVIGAIGMKLNCTFGPAMNKINIVTEGMSDYIYFCMMAKILNIDTTKYAIIPSVGASNCVNICTILHGWGCQYIAVFDYDKAGVESGGEHLRKKMMLEYNHHFCYLLDVNQSDIDAKTYQSSPYMIENIVTIEDINRFCEQTRTSNTIGKPLMAKLISNAVESGTFEVGDACKTNFNELFDRIFSYCSN